MRKTPLLSLITALFIQAELPTVEASLALEFDNNVTPTNATQAQLGNFISGGFTDFEEVAAGVDARVSGFVIGSGHTFDGTFPNHGSDNLGFLYTGNNNNGELGGIRVTIDFFQSDGVVNGMTQLLVAQTIPDFEFLVHDVDGEPSQDEFVQAFLADGLFSYQLANTNALAVANNPTTYQFMGGGTNLDENDASGATILRFLNSSSVSFNFFAQTNASAPNGVFQALDGDVDTIARSEFAPPVIVGAQTVPEPSGLAFTLVAFGAGLFRRGRRKT